MAKNQVHGILVTPHAISYTTLEEKQDRWSVVETRSVPLQDAEPTLLLEQEPFSEALRPHVSAWSGRCTLAVPVSFGMLRIVDLPSVDEEEIESMVELQVDKYSPYPVEQLQISYETVDQTDRTTRVLVVAVLRDRIESLGEACRDLGLRVDRIDVDVLGWWKSIREEGEVAKNGRGVSILCEADDAILLITENGSPVLVRSLGPQGEAPRDEYCNMIAEETEYALTSVETEWGSTATLGCRLWHRDQEQTDLAAVLEQTCGFPVTAQALETLKPLSESIALRTSEGSEEHVNLAPVDWEVTYRSKVTQRNFLVATGSMLIVWLVVVSGFLIALGIQRSGLKKVQGRLESLKAPAEEVKTISANAVMLKAYTNRTNSALETLRSIAMAMPDGIELNQFKFVTAGTVAFEGVSPSQQVVLTFQENLQLVETLEDVNLERMGAGRRDRSQVTFRFTAKSPEGSS
jgi:Tfp pilus assembly protein PilN